MMEIKDYTCLQCRASLRKMGKYWVCDTCRIVDVDASGYKSMRESITSKEGEIAIFLNRAYDVLKECDGGDFKDSAISGTLSALDNELLNFSSRFYIAKKVIETSMLPCDKYDRLLQQELYQILTLMESDTAKELLKENNHG